MEIFVKIHGFSKYEISNIGTVRNSRGIIMKSRDNLDGYLIIDLRNNGKRKSAKIHRLIAEHFIDNNDNKICIDHIDGNRRNNTVENLRWCNRSENSINKKLQSNNTSGHRGVCFDKHNNIWISYVNINKISVKIGSFKNKEDAIEARIKKANEIYGEFIHCSEKK
jgi:hypothetical protein